MPPILEEAARRGGTQAIQEAAIVRPEATECRQVVRALEHVHGVDLQQAGAGEHARSQRAHVDLAAEGPIREALCGERDPPCLGEREVCSAARLRHLALGAQARPRRAGTSWSSKITSAPAAARRSGSSSAA